MDLLKETPIDMILLDLNLPDSQGEATLFTLVSYTSLAIPIMILTGNHDRGLENKLLLNGAQEFLVKGEYDEYSLVKYILHSKERHSLRCGSCRNR